MCDYSLMSMPNRLAIEGEDLFVYPFATGSLGLGPPTRPRGLWASIESFFSPPLPPPVVVCVPPGARLELSDIPFSLQAELGVGPVEEVVFTQISNVVNSYRDAVRFSNGSELLLQRLQSGQRIRVLELSPWRESHSDSGGAAAVSPTARAANQSQPTFTR